MRSTNSSISRSTMSGARRRRCRASSPGCAQARAEVKRDMEIARDEVRVMTVHGAKGLEAPIVILADTMTPPAGPRPPRLLELAGGAVIWAGRKDDDVPAVAAARAAALAEAEHEYRRLLYVAMTRAADRLIVCGADGERARRPKGCWYDLMREPLAAVPGRGRPTAAKRSGATANRCRPNRRGRAAARPKRRTPTAANCRRGCGSRLLPTTPRQVRLSPSSAVRGGDRPRRCARQRPPPPNGARRWRGGASCTG